MELTWYGLSCFRLTERGFASVVTDPIGSVGLAVPKLKADVVTVSHAADGHANSDGVAGEARLFDGPGEYEVGGVFVTGVATHAKSGVRNIHFSFTFGGLRVVHLGDISKVPSQTQIEALGDVNVLLLPVGGGTSLNAVQSAEIVSMLEPNYVVPMHYATPDLKLELDGIDRFLSEMGVSEHEEESSLKISASNLPDETQIVVLAPRS